MEEPRKDDKMYNLYLKGLSTNNDELDKIRNLFKKYGLDSGIWQFELKKSL